MLVGTLRFDTMDSHWNVTVRYLSADGVIGSVSPLCKICFRLFRLSTTCTQYQDVCDTRDRSVQTNDIQHVDSNAFSWGNVWRVPPCMILANLTVVKAGRTFSKAKPLTWDQRTNVHMRRPEKLSRELQATTLTHRRCPTPDGTWSQDELEGSLFRIGSG